MIKKEKFSNAYTEVYEIIKYLEEESKLKIPEDFLKMVKENKNDKYSFKLEEGIKLEEQNLLRETRAILAYIFLNYLSTEDEKRIINKKFKEDIFKEEKRKKEIYPKDVFKKKKKM